MKVDFSRFYEVMNKSFWKFFEDKNRCRISYGGAGSGKCLKNGTRIIMYSGHLKNVEDIIAGDLLMGPDSKPRKVLETHSGYSDLYKVNQKKGMDYIVNENHILTLKKSTHLEKDKGKIMKSGNHRRSRGKYPDYKNIVNIQISDYLKKSKTWKRYFRGYRSKINFNYKEIKIDPYFLGVWLGDGSSGRPHVTTMDNEIISEIYEIAKKYNLKVNINTKNGSRASTYCITTGNIGGVKNLLLNDLRNYNLLNNKHIPDNYLYNSKSVRLRVLAGLLDTDGHMQGGCYNIIQKNEKLSRQIAFLASSLGFRSRISKKIKHCIVNNKKFFGTYFDISISGNVHEIPVKIERKKIKNFNKNKDTYITQIHLEYYGKGEYSGFSVDGDHLFMLEDCTVVHNSHMEFQEIIYKMLVEPGHNYLICRKVANTNKNSTYALFNQIANLMGLLNLFKINKSDLTVTVKHTGYMIVFKGLDDIEKIKSFTFSKGILTDIVIEEASEILQSDFDQLNVRLRGEKVGEQLNIPFQITMLLNPITDTHWIKREFIDLKSYQKDKVGDDGEIIKGMKVSILKTTYKNNKFIDDDYKAVLEGYRDVDYEFYKVYCLGEWGSFGNLVFSNWSLEKCPYKEKDFDAIYVGQDFGYDHPQVIVKIGFKDGVMYTYNELCLFEKTNQEVIDLNTEFDILHKNERVICDNAEPSMIKEWNQKGYFGAVKAVKGKDSISRGIDYMRSQKWIIDPDKCPRTVQEVQTYHRREDKDGNLMDEPVKLMDDSMDAHRYALEPLSRMKGKPSVLSGSKSDNKKKLIDTKKIARRLRREAMKEKRGKENEKKDKKINKSVDKKI